MSIIRSISSVFAFALNVKNSLLFNISVMNIVRSLAFVMNIKTKCCTKSIDFHSCFFFIHARACYYHSFIKQVKKSSFWEYFASGQRITDPKKNNLIRRICFFQILYFRTLGIQCPQLSGPDAIVNLGLQYNNILLVSKHSDHEVHHNKTLNQEIIRGRDLMNSTNRNDIHPCVYTRFLGEKCKTTKS